MFTFIEISLLLLPAIILWAIPKTRRSAGSVVTAWKTVPLGCVTMVVLPNVLIALLAVLGKILGLPEIRPVYAVLSLGALIFGIFAGIRVITGMKNYIRKRYGTADGAEPESKKPYYVAFVCLALTVVVVTLVPLIWFMTSNGNYRGPWRTYPVVTEHGTELAFQERSIHPFLAEYDYRFRFRKNGQETFQDLWLNTGGRTYFNVFRLKNGRLLFSDKNNDYIVEVKSRKVYMLEKIDDVYYAGLLPEGKFDSFGFSQGQESGKVHLHIGKHFIDAEPVTDHLADPKYIGCITTGFFPASEKPFQPVEKRFFSPMKISGPAKPKKETNQNNDKGRK